ncbi:MAG: SpoIIIAH-like family protein [Ruminococcus sp.]|nr:SpoIIIAH-like family protein [Ruminococcus sp.]
MKFQKRHIVLASLILALSAAVFINWQFSDAQTQQGKEVSKELGAATYVNSDTATGDEIANVAKQTSAGDEYFAKALLEREQARDKAIEIAQDTLAMADSSDDAKTVAVEQLNKLEDNIVTESSIESILKGKGFSQCLCNISENSCTVTISKGDVSKNAPLIIKDAVLSQLEIDFNDIKIIEV